MRLLSLSHPPQGPRHAGHLLLPLHARGRRPVGRDHQAHRGGGHPPGHRPRGPLRGDRPTLAELGGGRTKGKVVIEVSLGRAHEHGRPQTRDDPAALGRRAESQRGGCGDDLRLPATGPAEGVPVVLLSPLGSEPRRFRPAHSRGTRPGRPVVALDYRGVGISGGQCRAPWPRWPTTRSRPSGSWPGPGSTSSVSPSADSCAAGGPQPARPRPSNDHGGYGPGRRVGIDRVGGVSWPLILKDSRPYATRRRTCSSLRRGEPSRRAGVPGAAEGTRVGQGQARRLGCLLKQLRAIHSWVGSRRRTSGRLTQPVLRRERATGDPWCRARTPKTSPGGLRRRNWSYTAMRATAASSSTTRISRAAVGFLDA